MIKQLFKAKALGFLLSTAFLLIAVSSFNVVKAQVSQQSDSDISVFSENQRTEFIADLKDLAVEVRESNNYQEYEKAIREFYYKEIVSFVERGYNPPRAIEAATEPTLDYARNFVEGPSINFFALVNETKDRLL